MASSIAAQLQKVRAFAQADFEPQKRPFTRPSVLFSPKEAADIDLDSILNIALSGLEVLISMDERFRNYKNDLFSYKSKELDRELKSAEENSNIDASISSYLRLLSGYIHLPSSLKTLEYLIRRYKVHVYNIDELILCALPYHDTHAFVRIVQLIDMGNSKWKFLDGVKVSGAPPPRKIIVQQCTCDMGVLEVLCNYGSPTKKYHPSRQVIRFCTALVIEALGSVMAVDGDAVKRILPFVSSGLQLSAEGSSDHKAGSLMIVGLLASKATLSPKLVNSLIRSISEAARAEANDSTDLQQFQLSFMALVNLVQLQSVDILPKKALEILNEIRDIGGILLRLSKEFNIDKFLVVLLESLVEYSSSFGEAYHLSLISILETVPVKSFVDRVVYKILFSCLKLLQKINNSASSEKGEWTKKILMAINKKYPSELFGAFRKFLEDTEMHPKKASSTFEIMCKALDGVLDISPAVSDSKIWFSLHHPKAEVRRATLSGLKRYSILKVAVGDSQGLLNIQDAVLRQVLDDDLTVVRTALSLEGLSEVISSPDLFNALYQVLERCVGILMSSSLEQSTLACDVAVLCINNVISNFRGQSEYSKKIAAMIFPLLLVLPKTQKLNLKALESAKESDWPFYQDIAGVSNMDHKLRFESIPALNLETVKSLAKKLSMHFDEYMPWLVHDCSRSKLSKTLTYLVMMQTLQVHVDGGASLVDFLEAFVPVLKSEWNVLDSSGGVSLEEFNKDVLDWECRRFLDGPFNTSLQELNANVLICIFWRILEAFNIVMNADVLPDQHDKWRSKIEDLFLFFAASRMKHCFKEHLYYLVKQCKIDPIRFLSRLFTGEGVPLTVQIEGLHCFAFLCIQPEDALLFELLAEFPSLLVPLASDSQDIRIAAMSCIEGLFALRPRFDHTSKKNGKNANWNHFLDEILGLMVQHKRLILSDRKFLSSLLTSLLSTSHNSLLVPRNIEKRFDQSEKAKILAFVLGSALKLPAYGKLAILSLLKEIGSAIVHVKEVEDLLSTLLKRRRECCFEQNNSCQKLSDVEVEITCLLLECYAMSSSSFEGHVFEEHILKALELDGISSEDPAIVKPCLTVLQNLSGQLYSKLETRIQDLLFQEIVFLFRNANAGIQNATKGALLRMHVTCSSVERMLDSVFEQQVVTCSSSHRKKIKKQTELQKGGLHRSTIRRGEDLLSFISSILDILLLKKDIENRNFLLRTLFKLVGKLFSDEWVHDILAPGENWIQASSGISQSSASTISYAQQATLLVVEDICASLVNIHPLKDEIVSEIDVKLLVECARSAENGVTCNHVFSLLTSITKVVPDKVLRHVLEILSVVGKSAVIQVDSHSQHVFENLISVVVPCWLSKMGDSEKLLEIFINILPEIGEHRRLSIVLYLLRTLGEHHSLASLLILLFRTLILRKEPSSFGFSSDASESFSYSIQREWEYAFALDISQQFSCLIWLPSLVSLLDKIGEGDLCQKMFMELLLAMHFILQKLEEPEFAFKLGLEEHSGNIQRTLEELMERVVCLMQLDARKKHANIPVGVTKLLKEQAHAVLRTITVNMVPSAFFEGVIRLLCHTEMLVRKKALRHLGETLKSLNSLKDKHKEKKGLSLKSDILVDDKTSGSFQRMCHEILRIIDEPMDGSNSSLKLLAVLALEVLANRFSSEHSVFVMCLASVSKNISSNDVALSSCCLRTSGALIEILGPRALPELPSIMKNVIRRSHQMSSSNVDSVMATSQEAVKMSIMVTLEAVLGILGGFLNPYLGDIIKLLVLHAAYVSNIDAKLKLKADLVRRLFTMKIPVRLALPPLLRIYSSAVESGDSSLAIYFEMLGNLVGNMDRSSVGGYHAKIFDLCLLALDIRRQCPASIHNINVVERSIINAMISLTMKLTETMFKPLFVRTIDWADSNDEDTVGGESINVDRAISFYGLVNKLAENHRSLFVPYFKYLLEGCVRHLTDIEDVKSSGLSRKKKKAKVVEAHIGQTEDSNFLSLRKWHLKALALSSLHKCFLYDTGSLKFLDSVNFQLLLKPIVSQIAAEPPASVEEHPEVPSVKEVDDLLVICIGQMAVTAGSDLLWKSLNHEVLMQTRNDKVRSRLLGLRIIKYLLQNLKEEYLIFLPETIPFLGELLEDIELPVKSLAQEIFKEMESMSGENLRQYL